MKHIKNILLMFMKRNRVARKNSTPAFRYFAASAALRPQNAAIGASLKASLPHVKFCSYAVITILTCSIIFAQPAFAQNKKETPTRISIAKKAKYSLTDNLEHFNFKAKKAADYDVVVLSPVANIISRPVKNKKLEANEELNFTLNTKYWKPGTYRIFIQIDSITVEQRKLLIKRDKHKR